MIGHSPLGFIRTNENNDTDKFLNKHNYVRNPNWREADHLAVNHKNYNFLACDWFKKVLFSTNPLAKLLSDSLLLDSLLLDSLLLDSLLSDSSISQSHSKM